MKIITQEEADAHQRVTVKGAFMGFFGGLGVMLPASYLMQRRWAYYRSLPMSIKALGVVAVVAPACVIAAERAGLEFGRDQWNDIGKEELEMQELRKNAQWKEMSATEKVLNFAGERQYSIIFGGWAASLLGSFAYIMRNKHETLPMKVVQARMYAQGLTIGMIIAAGAFTSFQSHRNKNKDRVDHSWRDILAAQELEKPRQKAIAAEQR